MVAIALPCLLAKGGTFADLVKTQQLAAKA